MILDTVVSSDKEVLELIAKESTREQGYRMLLHLYQKRVYWLVRRMVKSHEDASDVTQEVWIRVFKSLTSFKGDAALYTWIYRIATNLSINHLKKKKSINEKLQLLPRSQTTECQDIDGDLAWDYLHRAVSTLPEKQQLVFNMRYFDELKYDEISAALGTSVGALKASYHLAVKKVEAYVRREV